MRLASGIAPIRQMLNCHVPVGLGVDGSASNDAGHLMQEARLAMLAARVRDEDPGALTAREALAIATRGGAQVLGRDDIGRLAPGMAADFIAINLNRLAFAGALYDPVAALLFCHVDQVDYSFINGRRIVDQGVLTTLDLPALLKKHGHATKRLIAER
jgi:cytosine/adenosine deaminase-related metal-dependent hydrolase